MKLFHLRKPKLLRRAFTLVEILTAVAITTIIVFTLVKMFDTSTKALQVANRQTDVWEAARATFGILRQSIGEVTTSGLTNRINLFAANGPSRVILMGEPMRLQDVFVMSRDNNQWQVNVFLLGKDRRSDPDDSAVMTLYRFQTNYPAYPVASGGPLDIDFLLSDTRHPHARAIDAVERYLDAVANGLESDGTVSVMGRGIVHLQLIAYQPDGRTFTSTNTSEIEIFSEVGVPFRNRLNFSGDQLPSSLDLEMFVLHPDRIEEFRSQDGLIARQLYMEKHVNSIQLFRTRIPVRRDLLARQ